MTKLIIKLDNEKDEFINWVTRLANRHGNKKLDSLRRLEIELAEDLRQHKITLAEAEEAYLRNAGLTSFNIDQIDL